MSRPLTWTSTEDIAIALADRHPETDPLTVRFTDLLRERSLQRQQGAAQAAHGVPADHRLGQAKR